MIFESSHCIIKDFQNDKIIFMGHRNENVYTIDISKYEGHHRCFSTCMLRVGCSIGDCDIST